MTVVILEVCAPVLHTYSTPPLAVSVAIEPEQTVSSGKDTGGNALTVAIPLAVAEHPEGFVTVTEYTPAVVVVMVSFVEPVFQRYV